MNEQEHARRSIEVRLAGSVPRCPRCGQQGLLAADIPHGWQNPDGTATSGTIPIVLCAACDHGSPTAGPLILYLLVHEQVTTGTLNDCAALIRRWAESITIPSVNMEQLEEEILAWHEGNL